MNWTRLARKFLSVRTESRVKRALYRLMPARHRSSADNVFHCCVHKTASQWIRAILSDAQVYRHSGLVPYHYQSERGGGEGRPITQRSFETAFPPRTVVSPLYIDFANYSAVPKPESARAFFVQRDPRDIVVSWYFSTRYSHPTQHGRLDAARQQLSALQLEEGLVKCVDDLEHFGVFAALRSWVDAAQKDRRVCQVRYEDLVSPRAEAEFNRIFLHCDIPLGSEAVRSLLHRYSFQRMSGGRAKGEEDKLSKYRKGEPGDWVNYFSPAVAGHFAKVTGDLVSVLGYGAANGGSGAR